METKVSEESGDKSRLWLKSFLFFCYRRETPSHREIYALLLGRTGEGRVSPVCAVSQLPAAQTNHHAYMVHCGVAYSEPLYY